MGLIKQVIIREMLTAGLDAMVSDVDVAWLQEAWLAASEASLDASPLQASFAFARHQ